MNRKPLYIALFTALVATACVPPNTNQNSSSNSSSSNPSDANKTELQKADALVVGASKNRANAVQTFKGPDGLIGIVAQMGGPSGQKEIVWSSPGLQVLLPTQALDATGTNLNEKALVEQNVYKSAEMVSDEVASQGFIIGKSGPVVTAFMDANCHYCHMFYKNIIPMVEKGDVRVRIVMVGFLKPTSIPKAVAILASKDQAKALYKDEMEFDEAKEEGGIAVLTSPRPELEAKVAENTKFMSTFGPISAPVLVACVKGQKVSLVRGMPPDMAAFVASLDTAPTAKSCSAN